MEEILNGTIKLFWEASKSSQIISSTKLPEAISININFDNNNISYFEKAMNNILQEVMKQRDLDSYSNIGGWFSGEGKNMAISTNGIKKNKDNEEYASIHIYCTYKNNVIQ